MARPSLPTFEVRQPYLSLLYHKIPGEADWTLIGQGRVASPEQTADTREYSRIGDPNVKSVPGQITTSVSVEVYVQDNISELARFLGQPMPDAGWTGSETITLDPTIEADLKIENYDGVTPDSRLLFTEYVNEFTPSTFRMGLEAEGDARIAEVSGVAKSYYIIPEAT